MTLTSSNYNAVLCPYGHKHACVTSHPQSGSCGAAAGGRTMHIAQHSCSYLLIFALRWVNPHLRLWLPTPAILQQLHGKLGRLIQLRRIGTFHLLLLVLRGPSSVPSLGDFDLSALCCCLQVARPVRADTCSGRTAPPHQGSNPRPCRARDRSTCKPGSGVRTYSVVSSVQSMGLHSGLAVRFSALTG
jgi:hypothetical protein